MSIDLNLLAAIIQERDFLKAQDKGIRGEHIEGSAETEIWRFVHDYYQQYRSTPDHGVVKEKFGVSLPQADGSLNYWIDEIKRRTLFNDMNELFVGISQKIGKDDPSGAYSELRRFVKSKELELATELSIKPVLDMKDEFIRRYDDAKAGKRGIETPWPIMTEWTNGWWPKDLSFIIARAATGKTFFLLCVAIAAVRAGKNVLFISCEMSTEDIVSRYYSMVLKKQYSAVRKGRLSFFEEKTMRESLEEYQIPAALEIMDAERGLDIVRIERAIERSQADLVLVDSAYRIRPRQKARDRFEAMSYVVDDLKMFAQVYGKSILASTQVNRSGGKKKDGMDQEDAAMSDVINWNSTNVFGLKKVEKANEDEDDRLAIYPIKVRENENERRALAVNWDFVRMNFDQIGLFNEGSPPPSNTGAGSW